MYSQLDGFIAAEQIGRISAFLKRTFKYGFCSEVFSISDLADDAGLRLFSNLKKKQYCHYFHIILPDIKTSSLQKYLNKIPGPLDRNCCSSRSV